MDQNAITISDLYYDDSVNKIVNRITYNNQDYVIEIPNVGVMDYIVEIPDVRGLSSDERSIVLNLSDTILDPIRVINRNIRSKFCEKMPQISPQKIKDFEKSGLLATNNIRVNVSDDVQLPLIEPFTPKSIFLWFSHVEYGQYIEFVWYVVKIENTCSRQTMGT